MMDRTTFAPHPPHTNTRPYQHVVTVAYDTARHAQIVSRAMSVDGELHPDMVETSFDVKDRYLSISIEAADARLLRIKTKAIYDNLILLTATVESFDVFCT
eukprot:GHVQ01010481.1.p1 GENE.GHVQ01010481.1~~GHVQ01010481.1.p1  ORF type:complete len:101 (+),score=14.01 GHVQ01010481.1:262-564(+)